MTDVLHTAKNRAEKLLSREPDDEQDARALEVFRHLVTSLFDVVSDEDYDSYTAKLDSLIKSNLDSESIWAFVDLISEMSGPFAMGAEVERGVKAHLSASSSQKAGKRHKENHAMKQDVFNWLDANPPKPRGMDAAATAIFESKLVPIKSWRTARDWVGEWKKLRSAGTA